MNDRAKKYLADILIAIELIEEFLEGVNTFEKYQNDAKTKSAVERQLAIIGEAVNQSKKLEENLELSNAKQIVDFRNRLIHAYFNVDERIVWNIIENHLSILKEEVEEYLN